MISEFIYKNKKYSIDLSKPLDISIPLQSGKISPNCFFAPLYSSKPVRAGDFIGSTQEGGPVNFFDIQINPHGNGTHTECVGHISKEPYLLRDCMVKYHFMSYLISIYPTMMDNGDRIITLRSMQMLLEEQELPEAVVIRTLPNDQSKMTRNYSGNNPVYMDPEAVELLNSKGVEHILIDLPSVDREEDGGKLLAHKTFWNYPQQALKQKTITELIFVDDSIEDGNYFLNIMVGNYDIDVSPSRPILYAINEL